MGVFLTATIKKAESNAVKINEHTVEIRELKTTQKHTLEVLKEFKEEQKYNFKLLTDKITDILDKHIVN